MPAYFSMTIHLETTRLSDNYVRELYSAIIDTGYSFKSGFWFHQDATFEEIIAWNQTKLKQGFQLGFTEHGSHDYMQILFNAPEYSEMRGFWMYNTTDISFNLIIPEHDILNDEGGNLIFEDKIAAIRDMGIHIWKLNLADAIQTSVELDGGCYDINQIYSGENVMAHPFAIIPKNCVLEFPNSYFADKELISIANNGILINSDHHLPSHLLLS